MKGEGDDREHVAEIGSIMATVAMVTASKLEMGEGSPSSTLAVERAVSQGLFLHSFLSGVLLLGVSMGHPGPDEIFSCCSAVQPPK